MSTLNARIALAVAAGTLLAAPPLRADDAAPSPATNPVAGPLSRSPG